jgi:mxaD protein
MAEGSAQVTIACEPDDVWKVIGDFGGLTGWMPGIEACDVEGDVRSIKTMGIEISEELRERDDTRRVLSYSVVQSPMPLEHHEATIEVRPEGSGSNVTWSVAVRPDEMLGAFVPIYQQSLEALKAHLEG